MSGFVLRKNSSYIVCIDRVSYFSAIAKTILAISMQTWTLSSSQENIQPTYECFLLSIYSRQVSLWADIPLHKCAPEKNKHPPNRHAFLDDIMSQSEVTTLACNTNLWNLPIAVTCYFYSKPGRNLPCLKVLIKIFPGREGVLPDVDAWHEVDWVAELREGHVQLVHGGQVFAGFSVTFVAGSFLRVDQFSFFAFLFVHCLNGGKYFVCKIVIQWGSEYRKFKICKHPKWDFYKSGFQMAFWSSD